MYYFISIMYYCELYILSEALLYVYCMEESWVMMANDIPCDMVTIRK